MDIILKRKKEILNISILWDIL